MKHLLLIPFLFVLSPFLQAEEDDGITFDPLSPPPVYRPVPEKWSDTERLWQGIPSLEVTSNNQLWAVWYSGAKSEMRGNYVLLALSNDRGETWTKPILAIAPPGNCRAFDPAIWMDPLGRLWVFWAQTEADMTPEFYNADGRYGVWAIRTDHPEKGIDAEFTEPFRLCDGVMLGKPIVTQDQRWLFPVAHLIRSFRYKISEEYYGAAVWESTDEGKTFQFVGKAYPDKENVGAAFEHNVLEKKDGSIKIYARIGYGIAESTSQDGGKTFPELAPSKIQHTVSRFYIRRLKSGNLLLVKNGKSDEDIGRTNLTAMISTDDGETWSDGLLLDDRTEVSYPDGNQAEDGMIYVAYDFDRHGAEEICVARFTEEDVLAGKLVDPRSQLRILINKATGSQKKAEEEKE